MSRTFLWKSVQFSLLLVSSYNLFGLNSHGNYWLVPSILNFGGEVYSQRFLRVMIAEWAEVFVDQESSEVW